jgi:hypothetical protein
MGRLFWGGIGVQKLIAALFATLLAVSGFFPTPSTAATTT